MYQGTPRYSLQVASLKGPRKNKYDKRCKKVPLLLEVLKCKNYNYIHTQKNIFNDFLFTR
jgi:hypothetical protein